MVFCRLDAVQSKAQHFEYYDPSFAAATTAAAVAAATTTTTAATITQACPVATVAGDATGYTHNHRIIGQQLTARKAISQEVCASMNDERT